MDGHVHVYDCFDPGRFFDAAVSNFRRLAPGSAHDRGGVAGALLLTEAHEVEFYETLRARKPHDAGMGRWTVRGTADPGALIVERGSARLIVCAGRQIATSERLEVLALLTDGRLEDGRELEATIAAVRDMGGVPVIPWGFGKWWARRGRILRDAVSEWHSAGGRVMLGDNGNRPWWAPTPAPFVEVADKNGLVVPGSDPLPFRSHETRAGTYGFLMEGELDAQRPLLSLKRHLESVSGPLPSYGRRVGLPRFVQDQVALQVRQKLRNRNKEDGR